MLRGTRHPRVTGDAQTREARCSSVSVPPMARNRHHSPDAQPRVGALVISGSRGASPTRREDEDSRTPFLASGTFSGF